MVMSYCCGTFTVASAPRRTLALHPASVTIVANRAAPPRRTTNERRFMDSVSVADLDVMRAGRGAIAVKVCHKLAECAALCSLSPQQPHRCGEKGWSEGAASPLPNAGATQCGCAHTLPSPPNKKTVWGGTQSCLGQRHALLPLVFPAAILVTGGADLVRFQEQHLRHPFV